MDTNSILYEVENLDKELLYLRNKISLLNKRKKKLLEDVITNMQELGEESFNYKGKKFNIVEKTKHVRKKNENKKKDTMNILRDEGINGDTAKEIYSKLTDALKGPVKIVYTLKH